MAKGDHVKNYSVRDGYVSTDNSTQTLMSINTDAITVFCQGIIHCWVHGYDTAGHVYMQEIVATCTVDDGGVPNVHTYTPILIYDPDAETWTITLTNSGTEIIVEVSGDVSGDTTWHGRMNLDLTESEEGGG